MFYWVKIICISFRQGYEYDAFTKVNKRERTDQKYFFRQGITSQTFSPWQIENNKSNYIEAFNRSFLGWETKIFGGILQTITTSS